jgi:hypothetical protein
VQIIDSRRIPLLSRFSFVGRTRRPLQLAAAALIVVTLVVASLTACTPRAPGEGVVDDPNSHPWREDLDVFARELPRRHTNLFFRLPQDEFEEMVRRTDAVAPELSEAEFVLAVRRILAAVGDAHTNLSFSFERLYPLRFSLYDEGIYCTEALPRYERALGAKLVAVDGVPVAAGDAAGREGAPGTAAAAGAPTSVVATAREITPHDNESQIKMMTPIYLMMPELLAAAGITESAGTARFTFESNGETIELDVESRPREHGVDLTSLDVPAPLCRRNTDAYYWFTTVPEDRLVYMQYNVCREDKGTPMAHFTDELVAAIDESEPAAVVIDMRYNTGGSSPVLHPLIDELAEDHRSGRSYELYVILGRNTFSSSVLNAIALRREADAVFVGEPSGGRPNHYGEVRSFTLPNTKRDVKYSTKYFTHYQPEDGGDPSSLVPDLPAPPTWAAYVEGVDPAMAAIRRRTGTVP